MIHTFRSAAVHRFAIARITATVAAILWAGGCADVPINTNPLGADLDTSGGVQDTVEDVSTDLDTQAKDAGGVDKDVGGSGIACSTETDCLLKVTGQGPCRLSTCVKGFCTEPMPLEENKPCSQGNLNVSSCQTSACDKAGECVVKNLPDMTVCGTQVCGKFCEAGACRDAKDGEYEDGNPCTKDFCDQGLKIVHEPIDNLGAVCDDKNPCTEGDACVKGQCAGQLKNCDDSIACTHDVCVSDSGCVHTPQVSKCTGDDPCVNLACSVTEGCAPALDKPYNPTATCDDGDDCTATSECNDKGQCVGKDSKCACASDADCLDDSGNQKDACKPTQCNTDTGVCEQNLAAFVDCTDEAKNDGFCVQTACNPKNGQCEKKFPNEGKACDDNSVCTSTSKCDEGICEGPLDKKCDDANPCTADACDPVAGCKYNAAEGGCDDGNPCTSDDGCAGGACKGLEIGCNDGVDCTFDQCDSKTGKCTNSPKNELCQDDEACTADKCDATKGCLHTPKAGDTCEDDDICTVTVCGATGKCDKITGYNTEIKGCGCQTDVECKATNTCTVGKCVKGECTFDPVPKNGSACETGDKCHVANSGKCDAGACTGGKAKDCSASGDGKCLVGSCEAGSGKCVSKAKADGQACDADGSACTQNDICKAGTCLVGKPVDCSSLTKDCTIGVCDKATGKCAGQPAENNAPCDDGNFCTVLEKCTNGKCGGGSLKTCSEENDQCNQGSCDATAGKCTKVPKPATTACDDGKYCTVANNCDGKGNCGPGAPRVCAGDEAKCLVGSCNETANACEKKAAPSGSTCDDGNKCTQTDKCNTSGTCVGASPKNCAGSNTECGTGVCTPSTGACDVKPKPSGTACEDGDACTLNDKCNTTGQCLKGTDMVCNDNNACTVGDKCEKGSCVAGAPKTCPPVTCSNVSCNTKTGACDATPIVGCGGNCASNADCKTDNNVCTTETCVSGKCQYVANTLACDDGDKCTVSDKCSKTVCLAGAPVNCPAKACQTVSCNKTTGACDYKPMASGTACTDDNACTTSDKCNTTGACIGVAIKCDDGNLCTSDACSGGKCIYTNNTVACEDGNKCTLSDKCSGGKCTAGTAAVCKQDDTKCTNHVCDSKSGACVALAAYDGYACEQGTYSACYDKVCHCKLGETKAGGKYSDNFYGSVADGYGGTIAVGNTYGSGYDGYIVRFDGSRTVRWAINASASSNTDSLQSVVKLSKGTFVAVGSRFRDSTYNTVGWLVEFDINGKILRNMDIIYGKSTDQLTQAVVDKYGTVWAIGTTYSAGTTARGWLVRLNATATSVMVSATYAPKTTMTYRFEGLYYDASYSRLTAVGNTTDSKFGGTDAIVVQYNITSSTAYSYLWASTYGGTGTDYLRRISLVGSYLVAVGYTTSSSKGGYDGWMVRLSRTSALTTPYSDVRLGGTGTDYFYDLIPAGSYLLALGSKYDGTANKGWMVYMVYTGSVAKEILTPTSNVVLTAGSYVGGGVYGAVGYGPGLGTDAYLVQTLTSGAMSCK